MARVVIPLDQNWHFKQVDGSSPPLPVSQFPTNVHLDLLHHKLIPDPFIGKNELAVQWVGERAWQYNTTFATPKLGRPSARAVLAFDGLDTFATVQLNGKVILETDNMFISERVDVTSLLRTTGENELQIIFDIAYFRAWDIVDSHPHHKWGCWNGDVSRLAVRKAQYHWGWDWGPVLLTCGPWRPINLEVFESRIADLHVDVRLENSLRSAKVVAHAAVDGPASSLRFDITLGGKSVASETVSVSHRASSAAFQVQSPELWYPIRYGKQPLYTVKATLLGDGVETRTDIDSMSKKIGLRRARLIQQPLKGQPGTSFFFEINNVPVFCGGSNWIPADSFIPRISKERYYDWVRLVADGNQSMIRVWGGGIYEEQALYDACDEMGILVWQDFMFGCGNYPAHPQMLRSVEREAIENVKRLRHHPSLVIWAGNNEDYQFAESEKLKWDPKDMNPDNWLRTEFPARYIYEHVLPKVCRALIPGTYYHPGSPWGGSRTTDPTMGDIHQWNVWHGSQEKWQDFDKLVGRFVSEFGMQAFPSLKTIDAYLLQGERDPDRYAQSSTVDFHNKAAGHERRIALYLVENFRYAPDPMEHFVYCTQLMQAECLASAYRLWRREWKGPGREYCSGALVWQLNDCWPVTSWSICDHHLRPKLAYFAVKREMAGLSIGMKRRETTHREGKHSRVDIAKKVTVEIWASNLTLDLFKADCLIAAWDVETGKQVYSRRVADLDLLANQSTEIISLPVPATPGNENRTVVATYLCQESGAPVARHVNWPEPFKHLHLQKPSQLRVELDVDGEAVQVSAEVPVKGLAVDCTDESVRFDDNLVDIVPGETMRIGVRGASKETVFTTQYLGMMT